MGRVLIPAAVLYFLTAAAFPQTGLNEKEPSRSQLGAPLYPGAVYIRTISCFDPYHTTAEYVPPDDMKTVLAFFERKLPEKRMFDYQDRRTYLFGFLLKTWSKFPVKPKKGDLHLLEREPNVQLVEFDSNAYDTLITFFERKPEGKVKAWALMNGRIMIRYTYRLSEEDPAAKKIIGLWRNTDRDQPKYYGSTLEFHGDGSYVFTFTGDNLKALGKSGSPIRSETGTYAILVTIISLKTDQPLAGDARKSGIAAVGSVSLSLELINWPRLTFIRVNK